MYNIIQFFRIVWGFTVILYTAFTRCPVGGFHDVYDISLDHPDLRCRRCKGEWREIHSKKGWPLGVVVLNEPKKARLS